MKPRTKLYKKKIHVYLTDEQDRKLSEDSKKLNLSKSDVFRKSIDKDFIYCNLFVRLISVFRNHENNLNQIARHTNETKQAGDEIIPSLKNMEKYYRRILYKLEKLK